MTTQAPPMAGVNNLRPKGEKRVSYRWDVCPHCLRGDDHIIGKTVKRNRQYYSVLICPNCNQEHEEDQD